MNGAWVAIVKWALGLTIAAVISVSTFFANWQERQDDAIAGCMDSGDYATIQRQIDQLQHSLNRQNDKLDTIILELRK